MKMAICSFAGSLVLGAGCATSFHTVLRESVGPCAPAIETGGPQGMLVVYPSWDVGYRMDSDYVSRYPADLILPSGEYRVSSYVPSLGLTALAVLISPGQTNTSYLDGSGNHLRQEVAAEDLVLLPDGNVAGCRVGAMPPASEK